MLTRQEIADNYDLWRRSFVDWSESEYGFYVDQRWNDQLNEWTAFPDGVPIVWDERQRRALRLLFTLDERGRLPYSDVYWFDIGKSAKTLIEAALAQWSAQYHNFFSEIVLNANSKDQASERAFWALKHSLDMNPYKNIILKDGGDLDRELTFRYTGNIARPNPRKAGSQSGINPTAIFFDEIWDYTSENDQEHFEQQKPSPARNISYRFVGSYPPFLGEPGPANAVLDDFFDGLEQPRAGVEQFEGLEDLPLFMKDGVVVWWNHEPYVWHVAMGTLARERNNPGVTEAGYLRIWEARRVQRENSFVIIDKWDDCEDATLKRVELKPGWGAAREPMVLGVDIGIDHDSSGVVARGWDPATQRYVLRYHRIFLPDHYKGRRLDILKDVKQLILDLCRYHKVFAVYYDPSQFEGTAGDLEDAGVKMVRTTQNNSRLVADTHYRQHIATGALRNYPQCRDLRQQVRAAVAEESGDEAIRIRKRKSSSLVDCVVADSMACLGVMEHKSEFERWVRRKMRPPTPMRRRVPDWDAVYP